jgi:hypothetical protein
MTATSCRGTDPMIRIATYVSPPQVVLVSGQQVAAVGRGGQRWRVLGVVSCPRSVAAGGPGGIEVLWRAVLALPGGYQPCEIAVDPDGTVPPLDLDLEQHLIIDRADPLVSGQQVSEALGGLGQQRMGDLA